MIDLRERRRRAILAVALAALALIVFSGVRHFDFVNYDDPDYVSGNPLVLSGLTLSGVGAAFGDVSTGSWVPLTLLSHMLDVSLFGTEAGGHHLTSALIHALTVALLFYLLSTATGSVWKSAFVAAGFGLHPLRAESVAWIAERKDVLCGLFMVGTALLHVQYVRALPAPPPQVSASSDWDDSRAAVEADGGDAAGPVADSRLLAAWQVDFALCCAGRADRETASFRRCRDRRGSDVLCAATERLGLNAWTRSG